MKILIATVLLGALGVGSFQFARPATDASGPALSPNCEAQVTCTPQGTCLLECLQPNGAACSMEIDCAAGPCAGGPGAGMPDCPAECPPECAPDCERAGAPDCSLSCPSACR